MSCNTPYRVGPATPVRETDGAVLFRVRGCGEEWVPRSVVHDDSEVWKAGQPEGELVVNEWWAEKRGWE